MQAFVAWSADDIDMDAKLRTQADDAEGLRRLQQQIDLSDEIWKSFCLSCDGAPVSAGNGLGVIQVPVSELKAIPALQQQYGKSLNSKVSIGIGMRLDEAQKAREVAKNRGKDEIVFYSPEIEQELSGEEKEDILGNVAEDMAKAEATPEPLAPMHGGPTTPEKVPEHSQAEALKEEIGGDPPPPEMTHAAAGLEEKMHQFAQAQDKKDQAQQHVDAHQDLKKEIAAVLQRVKEQVPILGQLKQSAPDSYQVIMDLVQSVIKMARGLGGGEPLQKGLKLPMPRARKRKHLNLPAGTIKDSGPSGTQEVGKVKVNHGDGTSSWISARAGMVTAVADRHAAPVLGQAGHPISSRNVTGH